MRGIMKTTSKLTKTMHLLIAFIFFLAGLMLATAVKPKDIKAYASAFQSEEIVTTKLTNNAKFEEGKKDEYPYQPNGFTSSNSNVEKNSGVINLKDEEFIDKYKNHNENETNQYVLMVKANVEEFGYVSSSPSQMTLDANSHYEISVEVGCYDGARATLCLISDDERIISLTHVGDWNKCYLYVSTDETTSLNVNLGLFSKGGTVLFDDISAKKLNDRAMTDALARRETNGDEFAYLDKQNSAALTEFDMLPSNEIFVKNVGESENDLTSYSTTGYLHKASDSEVDDGEHDYAFVINHIKATYNTFYTKDNFITVEKGSLVRVEIPVKALKLSGQVTIKLIRTGSEDYDDEKSINLSGSTSENLLRNGYQNNYFYIKTSHTQEETFKLAVVVGNADNLTSGKVYISTITICPIDETQFSNASSSNKLDLTGETDENYFANGQFNSSKASSKTPYLNTPDSWSVGLADSGEQKYGVVNTNSEVFERMREANSLPSSLTTPGSIDNNENDNVLMMYNISGDKLSYTSETENITSGSYHLFSLALFTNSCNAEISIVNDNATLFSTQVNTNGEWKMVNVFMHNPYLTQDVQIRISLNSDKSLCFVDNVSLDLDAQPTENTFNEAKTGNFTFKFSLSNIFASKDAEDYATPELLVESGDINGDFGIINIESPTLESKVLPKDKDNTSGENIPLNILKSLKGNEKNILGIYATEKTYFSLTSKLGFSLDSANYYKISIDVFTPCTFGENEGASLSITSFSDSFTAINADEGWRTYTFFIHPESNSTSNIVFGLGTSENPSQGRVFFGNLTYKDYGSDQTTFDEEAKAGPYALVLNKLSSSENNNENNEENAEETNSNGINWWYVAPSIVFAVVIIICVAGVLMRKVKWKKPNKKVKNEYDRNKTVNKQYYSRKATAMRDDEVRKLEKELQELTSQRTGYEEEYKVCLNSLRELKIKRASASEIAKVEKEMRKNKKLSSAIGISIQRKEEDIEYAKSEPYLNALIRKLSSEKPENAEEPAKDKD